MGDEGMLDHHPCFPYTIPAGGGLGSEVSDSVLYLCIICHYICDSVWFRVIIHLLLWARLVRVAKPLSLFFHGA